MAKVYVSSTVLDLKAERDAVMEWLVAARHQPIHSYLPDSETVRKSCLQDIVGCDLYVLILGFRYGFQPEEGNPENLSITHLEFRRAGELRIPRIALLHTIADAAKSDLGNQEKLSLVQAFRREVEKELRPAQFNDLGGLLMGLSTGVQSELEKVQERGAQRGSAWLETHLQLQGQKFAAHMAALELKSGARPEELYLEVLVAERVRENGHEAPDKRDEKEARPLQEVLELAHSPVLLLGEGGAGKTTSLLYVAARLADRAREDKGAPVPIYVNLARLTKIDDVPDLYQLIVDAAPSFPNWEELLATATTEARRILFLFDSFNEIAEKLQRTCTVVLKRFVDTYGDRHWCLVGSRAVPNVDQFTRPPSRFQIFEILRLAPVQVRTFLDGLGLGTLYGRMPKELRDLAGNPFMLLAIARTLAGAPEAELPRNQGRLYQQFTRRWMENEQGKRRLAFNYERVKEPLLAYLSKRMTAAGQTALAMGDDLEEQIEKKLEELYQKVRRRGGMPDDWKVDGFLDELVGDGLLLEVNGRLHFMHQSVQEYFTAVWFGPELSGALAELTPKLRWELVADHELPDAPNHRFVGPLRMLAGLLDNSTKLLESLAERNPILAAAAIASANRVDGSLLVRLEESWLKLLDHEDARYRRVGISCLALASMSSRRVVRRLVETALAKENGESKAGIKALARLDATEAVAQDISDIALGLSEDQFEERKWAIGRAISEMDNRSLVKLLFERWRVSSAGSSDRRRTEYLLASVKEPLLKEELERIRESGSDPTLAAEVARALATVLFREVEETVTIISRGLEAITETAMKQSNERLAELTAALQEADEGHLTAALQSSEPAMWGAAALVMVQRPIFNPEAILRRIILSQKNLSLLTALAAMCGEAQAIASVMEIARAKCLRVGELGPELAPDLNAKELSPALASEIQSMTGQELKAEDKKAAEGGLIWKLSANSWSSIKPDYELRVLSGRVELYDCAVTAKAMEAIAEIPGEASLRQLRSAIDEGDGSVQTAAIRGLAERGDASLPARLMALLRTSATSKVVKAALDALEKMRAPEASGLVEDLLMMTERRSDVHPLWGECQYTPGWSFQVHCIFVDLNADAEIRPQLDQAMESEDAARRLAAAKEISRWFAEEKLSPERMAEWRRPERVQRLLSLAVAESGEAVRAPILDGLAKLGPEQAGEWFSQALAENAVPMQLAAAEMLARHDSCARDRRVAEAMLRVVKTSAVPEFRQRAGKVLSTIPDGVEPFYQPIQAEFDRGDWSRIVGLAGATLEILPEDPNLFRWRGDALRQLGQLSEAAEDYRRASELASWASEIPLELADTLIDLGDYQHAVEAARKGVAISKGDAEIHAILAWSCYKAGLIEEAQQSAGTAIDLDPVQPTANWVFLLAHLRQEHLDEARAAFEHVVRVREILSPDLDTSFIKSVRAEFDGISSDKPDLRQLLGEIKDALPA
jgi:tetratricopeptide (TPR) repeat protein